MRFFKYVAVTLLLIPLAALAVREAQLAGEEEAYRLATQAAEAAVIEAEAEAARDAIIEAREERQFQREMTKLMNQFMWSGQIASGLIDQIIEGVDQLLIDPGSRLQRLNRER